MIKQINKDMVTAMKGKNAEKLSVLRAVKAALADSMRGGEVTDAKVIGVIRKQIKQRQDSAAQFKKAGREELEVKEVAEIVFLQTYLPVEISDEALEKIVNEEIEAAGATSKKDAGKVIKAVSTRVDGAADGKRVSQSVISKLPAFVAAPEGEVE